MAIGLDTAVDPRLRPRRCRAALALQGNLDPLALLAGGARARRGRRRRAAGFAGRPHIFNLGHGILPETPIAHVDGSVARVRGG